MRTAIISVLALAITATASSIDEALVRLYVREALAEPGFGSFLHHAEHDIRKAAKGAGQDIKKGAKFLNKHKGAIEHGAESAASVAGSLAPYIVERSADPDAEASFSSFFHHAEKDIKGAAKKAGKYLGHHKGQIIHGAEEGAQIAGTVAPFLLARDYGLYEIDGDELAAREFDDELEARDFEDEEYFW
ncbi:MAG: hypothetical protein GOMPHAMPRED_000009 [Gomphillus americanus]|uniref:Uncharacterized protein n=1 Tax=Gomphillus americanus TaxID=1940652 RepID=A0A8H3ECS1_9LECA|nr:MAG: hypothetical protein GOMPHAMPRED_000009 [Gomphillus americanus]